MIQAQKITSLQQKTVRDELNFEIYSFAASAWLDYEATSGLIFYLNASLNKLDLAAHHRIPEGSSKRHIHLLDGFIYEDYYNILFRLVKISYMRGHNRDSNLVRFAQPMTLIEKNKDQILIKNVM